MIDVHCHIVYCVDDGSKSFDESMVMVRTAKEIGIDTIVATPHVHVPSYNIANTQSNFTSLAVAASELGVTLELGHEILWDALVELTPDQLTPLCRQGTRTLLIEFRLGITEMPQNALRTLFSLQREGFDIMIAHPERYVFIQNNYDIADELVSIGCRLQLDALSLTEKSFAGSKKASRALLKRDVYYCCASDAHSPDDYIKYGNALLWMRKKGYRF